MLRTSRSRTVVLLVALFTGVAAGPGVAQTGTPSMFSVPKTPNPLGQPFIGPDGFVPENVMTPPPPLRPEDKKYVDLNGAHMKDMVREITAISLKDRDSGNLFWGRNIGTLGHVMIEDWTVEKFKKIGLTDVHKQVIDVPQPQWSPKSYDITFTGEGVPAKLVSARPSIRSQSTPPGGLDLDLMWLGLGTEADYVGRDVKGKAVLVQDIPLPGDISHSVQLEGAVKRAYEHGAAAVGLVFGISDNFTLWQATRGGFGFNLGYEDGIKIRNALGAGKSVKVHYKLDAETKTGVKSADVWGTLPGMTDEEVIIVAHLDGYFEAALDNASGIATMINMAEHYAKIPKSQRRRTIKFLGSVGHHDGPGTMPVHNEHDWSKVAWVINLEHTAVLSTEYWGAHMRLSTTIAPMRWAVNASPAAHKIVKDSLDHFHVATQADVDSIVGEISAIYQDAPSLTLIISPEVKHTEQDTPQWVPAVGLEQMARVHTRIIDQLDQLDRKDIMFGKWPEMPARRSAD